MLIFLILVLSVACVNGVFLGNSQRKVESRTKPQPSLQRTNCPTVLKVMEIKKEKQLLADVSKLKVVVT